MTMRMIIGNKNYSSWSMRPWLLLKELEIEFEERQIFFGTPEAEKVFAGLASNHKVPVLVEGDLQIWESLAICEYAAERARKPIWPALPNERARGRSFCYEMATSFFALRQELPLNIHRTPGTIEITSTCRADIRRIDSLWSRYRDDRYFFGPYSVVDAFFTPVASRFQSYAIDTLSESSVRYMQKLMASASYGQWREEALQETHRLESFEL